MNEAAHPKPSRLGWLIFLASFVVYQANLRPLASGDTLPAALLPFSILLDGSLHLDRFAAVLLAGQPGTPYYLHERDHHFYSTYPPAQPILLTPLYIPVIVAIDAAQWPAGDLILLARVMEKLMAGALAAASVALFFLLLDRLTSRRNALALSAAYGFGTATWAISSQALWQHTGGELLLVATLLALERSAGNPHALKFLWLAGAWAGLALMVRPVDGLLAGAIVLALLRRRAIGALGAFLAPVILCGSIAVAWNLWLFQNPLGGYGAAPITHRVLEGLAGILFSPGRGLLIYCPFLLFAIAGIGSWRNSLLLSVSAAYCAAHLVLVGFMSIWWGGQCWGPRLLTEIMPFLTLLILPSLDAVLASRWPRALFICLLAYSVSVQAIGVFCYPNGSWDTTPISADNHPERFWDWIDNPIYRTARAGAILKPHEIALEGALHGKAAAIRRMREAGYKGF